jgi:hypothetical protein
MFSGMSCRVVPLEDSFQPSICKMRAMCQRAFLVLQTPNHPYVLILIGKSTELLRRIRRYTIAKRRCLMVKYKADTRYSETEFSTHDKYVRVPFPPLYHFCILRHRLSIDCLVSATITREQNENEITNSLHTFQSMHFSPSIPIPPSNSLLTSF